MLTLDENYWSGRYRQGQTQWDVGTITTPIKVYIDSLTDKDAKILVPGGGNGHEASYLFNNGFNNVYLLDFAQLPLHNFQKQNPDFPASQLLQQNFFEHKGSYDLIIEQTFFCALHPSKRSEYAEKMGRLLKPGGKLCGLLFDAPMNSDAPPYGGTSTEYSALFNQYFNKVCIEPAYNSIAPRAGKEVWLEVSDPKV